MAAANLHAPHLRDDGSAGAHTSTVLAYAIVAVGALLMLAPFWFMFVFATHSRTEIMSLPPPVFFGDDLAANVRLLTERLLPHAVLNARHIAQEAEIVAQAGQRGQITVSTNMAGRGTDIKLGDDVKELGGLHVICTELHDSARIDRQLIGRCGRQGDPGTWRQYLALDDDILVAGYGVKRAKRIATRVATHLGSDPERLARVFRTAQQRVEARHVRQRRILEYMERQRAEAHMQMSQDPYLDAAS
jgi:hypothetical protein